MVASLVVIACAIAAALLVRVQLRWIRETAVQSCARCHTPAEQLTDFICPGCGRDVRECGLVAWTRGTPASALAAVSSVLLFTALAACITNARLSEPGRLSKDSKVFQYEYTYSPTVGIPRSFSYIHVIAGGTMYPPEKPAGDLWLDLVKNDGNVSTLHVSLPSLAMKSWRCGEGKIDGSFGAPAVDRWLEACGVDDASSRAAYARQLDLHLHSIVDKAEVPKQMLFGNRPALMGGGGGGSSTVVSEFRVSFLLLLFAPVGLGLIWLVLRSQRRRARRPFAPPAESSVVPIPETEARCGACGYRTTGLQTLTCPECGNDLRTAGIVIDFRKPTLGLWFLSSLYFTFAMTVVGILLVTLILQVLPAEHQYAANASLKSPPPNPCVFTFSAARRTWSQDASPLPVTITIDPNTRSPNPGNPGNTRNTGSTLHYDPRADAFIFPDGKSQPFQLDKLLAATKSAGADITDPLIIAQAKEAMNLILSTSRIGVMQDGATRSVNTATWMRTSTSNSQPPIGVKPILICGVALLWLLGLRELLRKSPASPNNPPTNPPPTNPPSNRAFTSDAAPV